MRKEFSSPHQHFQLQSPPTTGRRTYIHKELDKSFRPRPTALVLSPHMSLPRTRSNVDEISSPPSPAGTIALALLIDSDSARILQPKVIHHLPALY